MFGITHNELVSIYDEVACKLEKGFIEINKIIAKANNKKMYIKNLK